MQFAAQRSRMPDDISRRDALKVLGAAALAPSVLPGMPNAAQHAAAPAPVLPLTSTSEVFVPPRGRAFMKFSFDFPEPSVEFGGLRFGFLVFTEENVYGLDASRTSADVTDDAMRLTCTGFVWAGGQERSAGTLTATFRKSGDAIEWDAVVEMPRAVRTVTAVVRGVPRGQISLAGGAFADPRDGEVLGGYTFGAGDLHGPGAAAGMSTPLAVVRASEREFFHMSSLDDRVRPKRFHFQPGESAYRVELVYEHDAWRDDRRVGAPPRSTTPSRRTSRTSSARTGSPRGRRAPTCSPGSAASRWSRRCTACTTRGSSSTTTRSSSRSSAGSRRASPPTACSRSSPRGTGATTGSTRRSARTRAWVASRASVG
jgi:hypothetical protein